jgi:hypothetical protein
MKRTDRVKFFLLKLPLSCVIEDEMQRKRLEPSDLTSDPSADIEPGMLDML